MSGYVPNHVIKNRRTGIDGSNVKKSGTGNSVGRSASASRSIKNRASGDSKPIIIDNSLTAKFTTTDGPVSNATVTMYELDNTKIGESTTNGSGYCEIKSSLLTADKYYKVVSEGGTDIYTGETMAHNFTIYAKVQDSNKTLIISPITTLISELHEFKNKNVPLTQVNIGQFIKEQHDNVLKRIDGISSSVTDLFTYDYIKNNDVPLYKHNVLYNQYKYLFQEVSGRMNVIHGHMTSTDNTYKNRKLFDELSFNTSNPPKQISNAYTFSKFKGYINGITDFETLKSTVITYLNRIRPTGTVYIKKNNVTLSKTVTGDTVQVVVDYDKPMRTDQQLTFRLYSLNSEFEREYSQEYPLTPTITNSYLYSARNDSVKLPNTNNLRIYVELTKGYDLGTNIIEETPDNNSTANIYINSEKPTITLRGNANIEIQAGETYVDEGAYALDYENNVIEAKPNTASIDNINRNINKTNSTFKVEYTATDDIGNKLTAYRTVKIVDNNAPIFTRFFSATFYQITKSDSFNLYNDVEVKDGLTDLTNSVIVTSNPSGYINTNTSLIFKTGKYSLKTGSVSTSPIQIIYTVTDSDGNVAAKYIHVSIKEQNVIIAEQQAEIIFFSDRIVNGSLEIVYEDTINTTFSEDFSFKNFVKAYKGITDRTNGITVSSTTAGLLTGNSINSGLISDLTDRFGTHELTFLVDGISKKLKIKIISTIPPTITLIERMSGSSSSNRVKITPNRYQETIKFKDIIKSIIGSSGKSLLSNVIVTCDNQLYLSGTSIDNYTINTPQFGDDGRYRKDPLFTITVSDGYLTSSTNIYARLQEDFSPIIELLPDTLVKTGSDYVRISKMPIQARFWDGKEMIGNVNFKWNLYPSKWSLYYPKDQFRNFFIEDLRIYDVEGWVPTVVVVVRDNSAVIEQARVNVEQELNNFLSSNTGFHELRYFIEIEGNKYEKIRKITVINKNITSTDEIISSGTECNPIVDNADIQQYMSYRPSDKTITINLANIPFNYDIRKLFSASVTRTTKTYIPSVSTSTSTLVYKYDTMPVNIKTFLLDDVYKYNPVTLTSSNYINRALFYYKMFDKHDINLKLSVPYTKMDGITYIYNKDNIYSISFINHMPFTFEFDTNKHVSDGNTINITLSRGDYIYIPKFFALDEFNDNYDLSNYIKSNHALVITTYNSKYITNAVGTHQVKYTLFDKSLYVNYIVTANNSTNGRITDVQNDIIDFPKYSSKYLNNVITILVKINRNVKVNGIPWLKLNILNAGSYVYALYDEIDSFDSINNITTLSFKYTIKSGDYTLLDNFINYYDEKSLVYPNAETYIYDFAITDLNTLTENDYLNVFMPTDTTTSSLYKNYNTIYSIVEANKYRALVSQSDEYVEIDGKSNVTDIILAQLNLEKQLLIAINTLETMITVNTAFLTTPLPVDLYNRTGQFCLIIKLNIKNFSDDTIFCTTSSDKMITAGTPKYVTEFNIDINYIKITTITAKHILRTFINGICFNKKFLDENYPSFLSTTNVYDTVSDIFKGTNTFNYYKNRLNAYNYYFADIAANTIPIKIVDGNIFFNNEESFFNEDSPLFSIQNSILTNPDTYTVSKLELNVLKDFNYTIQTLPIFNDYSENPSSIEDKDRVYNFDAYGLNNSNPSSLISTSVNYVKIEKETGSGTPIYTTEKGSLIFNVKMFTTHPSYTIFARIYYVEPGPPGTQPSRKMIVDNMRIGIQSQVRYTYYSAVICIGPNVSKDIVPINSISYNTLTDASTGNPFKIKNTVNTSNYYEMELLTPQNYLIYTYKFNANTQNSLDFVSSNAISASKYGINVTIYDDYCNISYEHPSDANFSRAIGINLNNTGDTPENCYVIMKDPGSTNVKDYFITSPTESIETAMLTYTNTSTTANKNGIMRKLNQNNNNTFVFKAETVTLNFFDLIINKSTMKIESYTKNSITVSDTGYNTPSSMIDYVSYISVSLLKTKPNNRGNYVYIESFRVTFKNTPPLNTYVLSKTQKMRYNLSYSKDKNVIYSYAGPEQVNTKDTEFDIFDNAGSLIGSFSLHTELWYKLNSLSFSVLLRSIEPTNLRPVIRPSNTYYARNGRFLGAAYDMKQMGWNGVFPVSYYSGDNYIYPSETFNFPIYITG
jgi:hypothetical protein